MFNFICIVITEPIKSEMTITRGMESTPSLFISNTVRFQNTFQRDGMLNTRHMKSVYFPTLDMAFNNISMLFFLIIFAAKLMKISMER